MRGFRNWPRRRSRLATSITLLPHDKPELYAYGVRNPQRFNWDPRNDNMFLADIGQNIVEEISPVTPGANLGWNEWEGSFRFISREAVSTENRRGDPKVTYPIVEWGNSIRCCSRTPPRPVS